MDIKNLKGEDLVKFIKLKVKEHESSQAFEDAKTGRDYYRGKQDVDKKMRLGVDDRGRTVPLMGLPNVIAKDNQYSRLVDQKVQYILSDRPAISCDEEEAYAEALDKLVDRRFMRTWSKIAKDALNCGIGWMYVYPKDGGLAYQKVNPLEVIPVWEDAEKESLAALIRRRTDSQWDAGKGEIVQKYYIELYTDAGVTTYEVKGGDKYTELSRHGYFKDRQGNQFTWGKIPYIYWRYTEDEATLLSRIKLLLDIQNLILSVFGDRLLEDNRNTILVLKNYDGENKWEVRGEMNRSGVLQVSGDGGVDTLDIEINADNFERYLNIIERKIIKNARGVDHDNQKNSQAPNELDIEAKYNDIDLDANGMELEFQASFEHLQWFFKKVHQLPENLMASLQFKRKIMTNKAEVVGMIRDSAYLSLETRLERHPLVEDAKTEMERIQAEEDSAILRDPLYFPEGPAKDVSEDEEAE